MDRRTKKQKLEAMANQSVSPNEAEVAKKKLAELKEEEPQHVSQTLNFQLGRDGVFVYGNGEWREVTFEVRFDDFEFTMASGFGEY